MLSKATLFVLLLVSLLTVGSFITNHEENKKVWTLPDTTNSPKPNESFSSQTALILNDERSTITSSTIPLDDNFQLAIKSYRTETEKRWADAKKEVNPHVTSSTKNVNVYHNTDAGVTFSFPSSLIITNDTENKTWGTLFVHLENEDTYPYTIGISVRDGKRFNNEQEKYEHDITYYNWQSVYEHFRNTVLQAWEPLSQQEEVQKINGNTFLKRLYLNPESETYSLSYLTYRGGIEYNASFTFSPNWIPDTDFFSATTSVKIWQDIQKKSVPKNILAGITSLDSIVKSLILN